MEEPTHAIYGSGRKGNLDYFFPLKYPNELASVARAGVAVELNYNYDDLLKIKKDIQKLIDPQNAYDNSLYFAYGRKRAFHHSVTSGIDRAFSEFVKMSPDFRLPSGFHVIVVEHLRGARPVVHESSTTCPCVPGNLLWTHTEVPTASIEPTEERSELGPSKSETVTDTEARYIDRATAEILLRAELSGARIPLRSKTARCMFERILDSRGQNGCKFGLTPLWGNEFKPVSGRVLYSEFMDWVERLRDSGQKSQKAGRASWT
jgi:hypothetical protein